MGEIGSFSWRVIDVIQKLIAEQGITDAEVISRSGMPRNTFYRKMRGDTPLTTDDIERLASALDVDPFAIIHAASAQNITPIRLNVASPIHDERAVAKRKSRDRGGDDGQG
ncbi:helix-turn-helix domain-containing protein [Microbacterium sp. 22303]|uniref:helix-turn-helix domain-containing protein n=1 Tax=Microbacterium sp. 22303 TaxID=3453905 RepID=UPI003F86876C